MWDDATPPEKPRSEPEIIPPDHSAHLSERGQRPRWTDAYTQARGTQRIYVARLGPVGFALMMLAVAAIVALIMIAVLGAVLIWIPIVAVLVIIAALFRLLRR